MKLILDADKAICCDGTCDRWFHADCVGMSTSEYAKYAKDENRKWYCNRIDCADPKSHTSTMELLLAQMSELSKKVDNLIGKVDGLKQEDIAPIKEDIKTITSKIDSLEPRIAASENRIDDLEREVGVLKTGSGHLNPEEIYSEFNERCRRARNVILYNVKENSSKDVKVKQEHDKRVVTKIVSSMNSQIDSSGVKTFRLGKFIRDKPRPLKVIFSSAEEARYFFQNFSKDEIERMDSTLAELSISRDRTPQERNYLNKLREELRNRTDKGEKDLTIKYSNGIPSIVKVSSLSKNDQAA
jgi:septal ring factor EnvC (AmiA/AmiB activator)